MYIIKGLSLLAYSNFMLEDKSYGYFYISKGISLENGQLTYDKEQLC